MSFLGLGNLERDEDEEEAAVLSGEDMGYSESSSSSN